MAARQTSQKSAQRKSVARGAARAACGLQSALPHLCADAPELAERRSATDLACRQPTDLQRRSRLCGSSFARKHDHKCLLRTDALMHSRMQLLGAGSREQTCRAVQSRQGAQRSASSAPHFVKAGPSTVSACPRQRSQRWRSRGCSSDRGCVHSSGTMTQSSDAARHAMRRRDSCTLCFATALAMTPPCLGSGLLDCESVAVAQGVQNTVKEAAAVPADAAARALYVRLAGLQIFNCAPLKRHTCRKQGRYEERRVTQLLMH